MSGSPSNQPRPSYEDGDVRDPKVRKMIEDYEEVRDERGIIARVVKRATEQRPASD